MEVLFIGGTYNGDLREVKEPLDDVVELPSYTRNMIKNLPSDARTKSMHLQFYKLMWIKDKLGNSFPIYMHGGANEPLTLKFLLDQFAELAKEVKRAENEVVE